MKMKTLSTLRTTGIKLMTVMKPMASDFTDLKKYVKEMQAYYVSRGKSPYKVALHVYKEAGIYSIQDLLDHRTNNPWSRVDL